MPGAAPSVAPAGTWVRRPREDFEHVCSEDLRGWLDGEYVIGSQPSMIMPTQHRPPAGQSVAVSLAAGTHRMVAMIRRPPPARDHAEWIVALAESPGMEWVPDAFRSRSRDDGVGARSPGSR